MNQARQPWSIFVTGTDTGVGKTVVAVGLLRWLAAPGRTVRGLKPVASGAERTADGLRNADALALQQASRPLPPYELVNPYCFEPAIAPHIAARDQGTSMPLDALLDWYAQAASGVSHVVMEGAGGWRLPLHPDGFLSDLPEALSMPVLLVVGLRLGCLNHARLTREAIAHGGRCRLVGWIANSIEPAFARRDDNLEALTRLLDAPPLAVLPHDAGLQPDDVAERLEMSALASSLGRARGVSTPRVEG